VLNGHVTWDEEIDPAVTSRGEPMGRSLKAPNLLHRTTEDGEQVVPEVCRSAISLASSACWTANAAARSRKVRLESST